MNLETVSANLRMGLWYIVALVFIPDEIVRICRVTSVFAPTMPHRYTDNQARPAANLAAIPDEGGSSSAVART